MAVFTSSRNKGQTFMPDYFGGLLVFGVVITIFLTSWSTINSNQDFFDVEEQMRNQAIYTTTFLVSTPGYPSNWEEKDEEITIPGFAKEDHVIDPQKLRKFRSIDYRNQSRLLQARNFYLKFENDSGTISLDGRVLEFGKSYSGAETIVPVERNILIDITCESVEQLICAHNRESAASNVTYSVGFKIKSGSSTIGNSLDSVKIEVSSGDPDMFTGTSWSNMTEAGVDKDGDGQLDIDLEPDQDDWIVDDGGSDLKIEFGGSAYTNTEAGDLIYLKFNGVDNPSSGNYDVQVQTSGDGNWQDGEIIIGENQTGLGKTISGQMRYVVWN